MRRRFYLGGAGAELEEAGLPVGVLVLELLDLPALRIALLPLRDPQLQEEMTFVHDISWMRRELLLNGHLIANSPK